jgi:ribosomal protein S18 acetylase RimI-like enzyme
MCLFTLPAAQPPISADPIGRAVRISNMSGVATKPEARGLGFGRLICLTALSAARARGRNLAVLHSTPMAVSLYRAMGFRDAAPFCLYAIPDSFHP